MTAAMSNHSLKLVLPKIKLIKNTYVLSEAAS